MRGLWNLASLQELINVKCGLHHTWSREIPTGRERIIYPSWRQEHSKAISACWFRFFRWCLSVEVSLIEISQSNTPGAVWCARGWPLQTQPNVVRHQLHLPWYSRSAGSSLCPPFGKWGQRPRECLRHLGVGWGNNRALRCQISPWRDIVIFLLF